MDYVYIGKIVGTHGIKGEIKIISEFNLKDRVFGSDYKVYIGPDKDEYTIKSYRVHKKYDMITLEGYNDINQVLDLIKLNVYCNKEDLHLDKKTFIDSELIGYTVYCRNESLGKVVDVFNSGGNNKVIKTSTYMFPYRKELILKMDRRYRSIHLKSLEGVMQCE